MLTKKKFLGRSYMYTSHPDGHNEPTRGRTPYRLTVSLEVRLSRLLKGTDQDVTFNSAREIIPRTADYLMKRVIEIVQRGTIKHLQGLNPANITDSKYFH